jgi:hypothetical protein
MGGERENRRVVVGVVAIYMHLDLGITSIISI